MNVEGEEGVVTMLRNEFLHYDGNKNKHKAVNIAASTNNNNNNNNIYCYNYQLLKREEGGYHKWWC